MKTIHLVVRGRVQMVFFRISTQKRARELGITGTVTNCPDGSVEIYAQGTHLEEFVRWCSVGPTFARVDSVEAEDIDMPRYEGFMVLS
jgi:acylphosphatase